MTEEKAHHYARTLAEGMGITFYVVRSRDGRFLPVQLPSDDSTGTMITLMWTLTLGIRDAHRAPDVPVERVPRGTNYLNL
jgi:hypothetical protein